MNQSNGNLRQWQTDRNEADINLRWYGVSLNLQISTGQQAYKVFQLIFRCVNISPITLNYYQLLAVSILQQLRTFVGCQPFIIRLGRDSSSNGSFVDCREFLHRFRDVSRQKDKGNRDKSNFFRLNTTISRKINSISMFVHCAIRNYIYRGKFFLVPDEVRMISLYNAFTREQNHRQQAQSENVPCSESNAQSVGRTENSTRSTLSCISEHNVFFFFFFFSSFRCCSWWNWPYAKRNGCSSCPFHEFFHEQEKMGCYAAEKTNGMVWKPLIEMIRIQSQILS